MVYLNQQTQTQIWYPSLLRMVYDKERVTSKVHQYLRNVLYVCKIIAISLFVYVGNSGIPCN